jgi:PST family polysaccharide transporter
MSQRREQRSETLHSYSDHAPATGSSSVKWNGLALVGRQLVVVFFSILLARMLGPASYGIVAQATVYITLTTLILDQGLSSALISRESISRRLAGAASTLNFLLAVGIAAVTIPLAAPIATFLNTPALVTVLPVLAAGLVSKSAAVVPRLLLQRKLMFRWLAVTDIGSALVGGLAGLACALSGLDYWSIVVQLLVTDVIALIVLLAAARPPLPNLAFGELSTVFGFGARVFVGNLISFASRNVDSIVVGKFLGEAQLGYYALSYRVLLTPIQMIGQTVSRVLFPLVARRQSDLPEVSRLLLKSTRGLALISFPLMAFVSVSSLDSIPLVLGDAWRPAIPVLAVLALTGARQSVTSINAPILLGLGRADTLLKFNTTAAIVQIAGMFAGLPFGILGVATGYTIAGLILTPLILVIQRRLVGTGYVQQCASVWPALHGSLWAAATYGALYLSPLAPLLRLGVGLAAGGMVYVLVIRVLHRKSWRMMIEDFGTVFARSRGPEVP